MRLKQLYLAIFWRSEHGDWENNTEVAAIFLEDKSHVLISLITPEINIPTVVARCLFLQKREVLQYCWINESRQHTITASLAFLGTEWFSLFRCWLDSWRFSLEVVCLTFRFCTTYKRQVHLLGCACLRRRSSQNCQSCFKNVIFFSRNPGVRWFDNLPHPFRVGSFWNNSNASKKTVFLFLESLDPY